MSLLKIKTSSRIYHFLGNAPGNPPASGCTLAFRGLLSVALFFCAMAVLSSAATLLMSILGSFILSGPGKVDIHTWQPNTEGRVLLVGLAGWVAIGLAFYGLRQLCRRIEVIDDTTMDQDV